MSDLHFIDLFVAWTPLAVAFLLLFGLVLVVLSVIIYMNRVVVCAWFNARWGEKSSAEARTIAIWTTGYYAASRLGIPEVEPISLSLCLVGWARAAWKFIRPDGPSPAPQDSIPAALAASAPAQEGQ